MSTVENWTFTVDPLAMVELSVGVRTLYADAQAASDAIVEMNFIVVVCCKESV